MHARFAEVHARFAEIDAHFAQIDSRFAQIDARFVRTISCLVALALLVIPIMSHGQAGASRPATYITKEEVDIGSENFAVGIVHRGATPES